MKRSAFTLVELLVVIAVIVILVAILIPAVNAARENARRNQCLANQRSLAMAMITYATANNGLPGYLNQPTLVPHSWAVSIFPMIGENRRYEVLMNGSFTDEALVSPLALLCPSDRPEGLARLNYVVNCGPAAQHFPGNQWAFPTNSGINGGEIAPHFTLFKDRRRSIPIANPPQNLPDLRTINTRVRIEDIPDGASNTILLSENVDNVLPNVWHVVGSEESSPSNANVVVWPQHQDSASAPDVLPTSAGVFTRDSFAVENLGFIWAPQADFAPNSTRVGNLHRGSRPSSRHPGTIIAAFADGSARPINDNIDIREWLRAVCPDSTKARRSFSERGLNLPL